MRKKIYIVVCSLFAISLVLQISLYGLNLKELLPSITLNCAQLALTTFVFDYLLQIDRKRKYNETIKNKIGNQYKRLISSMAISWIELIVGESVTKEDQSPYNRMIEVKNDIDKYLIPDFFNRNRKKLVGINSDFTPKYQILPYELSKVQDFKIPIETMITEFLCRFVTILPEDIVLDLCKISDLLKSPTFSSTAEFGAYIPIIRVPEETKKELDGIKNKMLQIESIIEDLNSKVS